MQPPIRVEGLDLETLCDEALKLPLRERVALMAFCRASLASAEEIASAVLKHTEPEDSEWLNYRDFIKQEPEKEEEEKQEEARERKKQKAYALLNRCWWIGFTILVLLFTHLAAWHLGRFYERPAEPTQETVQGVTY